MYRPLWDALPVPTALKVVIFALLALLVVAICFYFVFPWVVEYIPFPYGNLGAPEDM
jgi:hypothetical protein